MNQFDQHNAMIALEEALVPSAGLIDSKTEADNLRLLVDFASLFNFYDRTNTINGNWSPFLLKDPVFLVASIAKTSFQKAYSLFINTCLQLKNAIALPSTTDFISNAFNQLFDQLSYVFQIIERWTYYLQESSLEYNLKTYILNSVKDTYGLILWSILELRKQLYTYDKKPNTTSKIPGIQNVNSYAFEKYDKKIWNVHKGELPYWTVLGLPMSPCKNAPKEDCFYISDLTQTQLYSALYAIGKKVFSFYSKCISYAATELDTVQNKPGHFPDTMLLRTFTNLLKIYQKQFNSLSVKHLNFYYRDILKQTLKSVSPDAVYVSSDLAKKTATFQLPQGTTFTAGLDANKQPILFETLAKVSLNPAKIVNAYTLSQKAVDTYHTALYLEKLPPVNVIAKDEAGAIKTWKTFGSQLQSSETASSNMAISFGSPMFYLTEATSRVITLNFTFSSGTFTKILQEETSFYFSTAKAWFEIPKEQVTLEFSTLDYKLPMTIDVELKMTITLQQTDPAIAAFAKNPDGYTCEWPLFKMLFSEYQNLADPPQIRTLDIAVDVQGLQNFQLYNDFGQLNAKKPFQLFGAAPKANQSFMVGNAEIFSKPAQDISFQLTWNPFPSDFDFATYYSEYNDFLNGAYSGKAIDVDELKSFVKKVNSLQDSFYKEVSGSEDRLFKKVLRKNTVNDTVALIQKNQKALKTSVDKQTKELQKKESFASSLIAAIVTLNTSMVNSITSLQNTLLATVQNANTVDKTTVNSAKTNITKEIDTTKETISKKISDAENTVLSTEVQEKKTLFKKVTSVFKKRERNIIPATEILEFSNTSFMVNFQRLENGIWETFDIETSENSSASSTPEMLYFPATATETTTIPVSRNFDFPTFDLDPAEVDATLQQKPLQLSDTTATGFLKMQLTDPRYGFGIDLYPKVVAAIALFNAEIIAEKIKDTNDTQTLVASANIPFVPMVHVFSGNYTASVSYDLSKNTQEYPLQCFYNTPFENYKVYDTTNTKEKIVTKNTTLGNSPARDANDTIIPLTALPIVPTFSSKGQLFIELTDLIVPAKVSFYFELARTYTEKVVTAKQISYSYLSTDGWKTLTSVADGTNSFTCSGIITINIPADISTVHTTISGTNYWIAMGTKNNPDGFPETSFLKTNGFMLQRIVASHDLSTEKPQINANVITSPQPVIPAIATTVQPFASFDGKAAETNAQMTSRVSTRLKTKDRLVTMDDFFNAIRLEFSEVYYSRSIYIQTQKQAFTYVIKRVANATDTNAFVPLLSECNELKIQDYITARVSPFVKVSVENFELNYVKITANIQLNIDKDVTSVAKNVNNGINIFLSPWITSAQTQITIDNGLNTAQLAAFINSFESVLEVNSISFQIGTKDFSTGTIIYQPTTQEVLQKDGIILVPSLNNLTKNSLIKYHL